VALNGGAWRLPLVCPRCRAAIVTREAGAGCPACGAFYPLTNGILHLAAGRVGAAGYDPHYFPTLAAVEGDHYWFAARREVVRDVLRGAVPDLGRRALFDLGCGSGGLLQFLGESGVPLAGACDVYPESLELVRRRVAAPLLLVDEGRFPPLGPGYGLVSAFDVLEHIDDDAGTLGHIFSVLEPGGVLVLTVPAHPFLFAWRDRAPPSHCRASLRAAARGRVRGPLTALHGLSVPLVVPAGWRGTVRGRPALARRGWMRVVPT
jgi:SAM-dependent methyltransferase